MTRLARSGSWVDLWQMPVIGLDIGGRAFRAAQLGQPGRTACIQRASPQEAAPWREPDASELDRLAAALARRGFEGESVQIAVPRSMMFMETLELPPRSSGAPVEKLARIELARAHRLMPDEIECAMWDVPAPSRGGDLTHVVACGMRRADGERLAALFAEAGLSLVGIDMRSWAMARGAGGLTNAGNAARALIDVAWDACTLAVSHRGVLVFERSVEDGALRILYSGIAERLRVGIEVVEASFDETLWSHRTPSRDEAMLVQRECRQAMTSYFDTMVPEVARSLQYAAHRYAAPIADLTLTGEGAALPGLVPRLRQQSIIEGAAMRVWSTELGSAADVGPEYACAIGLSMARRGTGRIRRAA